jgi:large subunit ribosomal protein L15
VKLHDLRSAPGAYRERKRVGRGPGSGKGKTSGKGMMGQKARSGPNPNVTFEGGQNRMVRRMPYLRGFKNRWRVEYQVINVGDLVEWPSDVPVTVETLVEMGEIRANRPLKILGDGELNVALTVHAHKFSGSAREKITQAGGTVVELPYEKIRRTRSQGVHSSVRRKQAQA